MKINAKFRNEDGDVFLEGSLNRAEVSYLLTFAINNLMAYGAVFNIDKEEKSEDEIRITHPTNPNLQ